MNFPLYSARNVLPADGEAGLPPWQQRTAQLVSDVGHQAGRLLSETLPQPVPDGSGASPARSPSMGPAASALPQVIGGQLVPGATIQSALSGGTLPPASAAIPRRARLAIVEADGDEDEEMGGYSAPARARRRERARCAAILTAPQAAGRWEAACHLALDTRLSRTEAVALLAKMPQAADGAAKATAPAFPTASLRAGYRSSAAIAQRSAEMLDGAFQSAQACQAPRGRASAPTQPSNGGRVKGSQSVLDAAFRAANGHSR